MLAPDFSEHFGRGGEFLIGLIGLLLLALLHKDVRRFARNSFAGVGSMLLSLNASLARNNTFYCDWTRALHIIFRSRRDLFVIVLALTAFDYLTGWHASFMISRFDLSPIYDSYDSASIFIAYFFSAQYFFSILRTAGDALFCWLAFRTTSGASYQEASNFRPLQQLAGLFLCIYGAQAFGDTVSPYLLLTLSQMIDDALFYIASVVISLIACGLGVVLLTARHNGARLATASSALFGYLLATHLLQWLYFLFDWASPPNSIAWVHLAEYHVSNFTYTLLWNIALVAFAVRLSGPPRETAKALHHAANAV